MKKILLIFFLIIPMIINAEVCNYEGISIESVDKEEVYGEVVEKTPPVIDGMNITLDLKMTEVGDYIRYKITVKNDTNDDYEFSKKNLVTNSDYINYAFNNNGKNIIKAHETKEILLTVRYNKKVSSSSFTNNIFNENRVVTTSLSFEDIVNPPTGYNDGRIIFYIILLISIILYIISNYKIKKGCYVILLFALLIIPLRVYSLCKCIINVTSNIEIEEFSSRDVYNVVSDESKLDSVSSKYVTSSSGVDFTKPSSDTNGKGVYIFSSTKDDEYPIYYYRGDVSDNHVLFGGICYRILRTTSKGGTKLIYDGLPDSENKCNNTGSDTLVANGIKYGGSGNTGNFGYSYTAGHSYKSIKITNITSSSVFAEDVSYEDGKYILNSDRYLKSDDLSTNSKELLKDHHYSCFKIDGEDCTTVNYVYMSRGGYLYYIILSGGEKIEDVINNDILNNGNGTNSTIKTYVENWFSNNLTSYMDYLEDEVYCNDRSIGSIGGWNKNNYINDGTDEENKLNFGGFVRAINGTPSLTCTNDADKFTTSTSNGNGKNTYPVGLITLDESLLAGFAWDQDDESTYLYNGNVWWSMSPTLISVGLDYIGVLHSMADNVNTTYTSGVAGGVRPVITLNNNAKIDGGNGTGDNPFTIAPLN